MTAPLKGRPLPDNLESIRLGYEEDPKLWLDRDAFLRRSAEEVEVFLRFRGYFERIVREPMTGPNGCFLLRQMHRDKVPPSHMTQEIRGKIALHIGLRPASFYIFIPEFYDIIVGDPEDGIRFMRAYRYSFSERCKHGRMDCVRPDHLIATTIEGRPLRPYERGRT